MYHSSYVCVKWSILWCHQSCEPSYEISPHSLSPITCGRVSTFLLHILLLWWSNWKIRETGKSRSPFERFLYKNLFIKKYITYILHTYKLIRFMKSASHVDALMQIYAQCYIIYIFIYIFMYIYFYMYKKKWTFSF